ncbi:MAG TPA: alpha/beta hydrolase [Actinomycetes bacterium]
METVSSKDGTTIAFDRSGDGPPVVLIVGGPSDRSANAPLAALLAERFTVLNYDRRGRGESGDTLPYAVDREFEDLAAVIGAAGGSAALVGFSGTGNIALEAAARGLPVTRLALWEPPFVVDDSRPPVPKDWGQRVEELVAAGRPGDALAYWMITVVGVPAEFVDPMRSAPFFTAMEPNAHMLVRDAALLGDFSLPSERLRAVATPTLLLDGGQLPWLSHGVEVLATVLPNARRRTLAGQPHDLPMDVLVPAIADFLAG